MSGKTIKIQRPAFLNSPSKCQACMIHIYPTGPAMGTRYSLENKPTILGREDNCHIVIADVAMLDEPAIQELMAHALEHADKAIDATAPRRLVIKSISAKQRPRRPRRKA